MDIRIREDIERYAIAESVVDIKEHLTTLFDLVLENKPKLVVELGVRDGHSTFTFSKACEIVGCDLMSIDIDDCSKRLKFTPLESHRFIWKCDINFAKEFNKYCIKEKLPNKIDILFIDTSHNYNHTLDEFKHYLPLMEKGGLVILHDVNLSRADKRPHVARAIEDFFDIKINEKKDFDDDFGKVSIKSYAKNNGLAIIKWNG